MKREILVLILTCVLFCGFIIMPGVSELNVDQEPRTIGARAILVVGQGQNYNTIMAAVTAANPGDTIYVYAGTYNEEVILSKTLSLIGNGSADTIIQRSNADVPIEITANWCNLTGFTLKGSGSGATDAGILINSNFNHIWDCNSSDNQGNGIRIESSGSNNTVENCIVSNNGRIGIRIQASPYNSILGCTILQNQDNGIHIQNTNGNIIENNTILESLTSGKSSISVSSVNDNKIKFNYLQDNDHGISVAMGDNSLIMGNTIVNTSSYAIEFGGASDDNSIYYNNFIDCNKSGAQATDGGTGNIWHNIYPNGGNYWSDWISPDLNTTATQDQPGSDGIVDNPYLIDGSAGVNDSYPLTNPFVILNITTADVELTDEDILYSVTYAAWTNMHGGGLLWNLNSDATWLTRTGSTITGTPSNSDVGSYWVDISVSDGVNQDSHNFSLTVQNVNDPPVITTTNVDTINETQLYSVDYTANDIDPTFDTFTWSVETNATFLSITSGSGVLSGTPSRNQLGSYFVNVIVNDGKDGWDNSNFTLKVLNINDPPVINTSDVITVNETQLYSVDYEAIDIDPTNDTLIWNVETNTSFLTMKSGTGLLSGTPSRLDLGNYFVNVSVNDGKGGLDFSNFTLSVLNLNDAPIINHSWTNFSFDEDTEDESISLNDWFMDYDADELIFDYSGNDKIKLTILNTGVVRLVPEANWSGYEVITFSANDSVNQVSDSVNVTVQPVNDAPYNAIIILAEMIYYEGQDQPAIGNASDVDIPYGDVLTYSWSSNVSGRIGDGMGLNLSLTAGFHNIILNVSDSAGSWTIATKSIEILKPIKDKDTDTNNTDDDNLPDDWEEDNFGNLSQDDDDDPDNDTFTNLQEWENKTDPNDPNDYPGKKVDDKDDTDDDKESDFISDNSWLIMLLFIVIILIIIIALIVSRKKKEPEEKEEQVEEKKLECPECGEVLGDADTICPACGTEFKGEDEFVCPECGAAVQPGSSVCPGCGVEIEQEKDLGLEDEEELLKELEGEEPIESELSDEEINGIEEELEEELEEGEILEADETLEQELTQTEEPVSEEELITQDQPVKQGEPIQNEETIKKSPQENSTEEVEEQKNE
jgi:parallel beta-helix repeat protein